MVAFRRSPSTELLVLFRQQLARCSDERPGIRSSGGEREQAPGEVLVPDPLPQCVSRVEERSRVGGGRGGGDQLPAGVTSRRGDPRKTRRCQEFCGRLAGT